MNSIDVMEMAMLVSFVRSSDVMKVAAVPRNL